jgi:2-polyprenyl-3-methyl-5-hydroxy-6-metoxy-1,4-benzoquinol methylase
LNTPLILFIQDTGEAMTSTYIFDQAWQQERERLCALEDLFDPATTRRLDSIGVREGWRCLEVGAGAGSVARWLAKHTGPSGAVLATDLDPRFLQEHGLANLTVQQHNILTDPLDDGAFDLVHARAVLEHIAERERALARMVAAVRPGGWVVVEDIDAEGVMASAMMRYTQPPELAALYERAVRGLTALFKAIGADAGFGVRLPQALADAGLEQIDVEVYAPILHGGTRRDWVRLTAEQIGPRMVSTGMLTADELARFLELTSQPESRYTPPFMVTAWGRRPA